MRVPKPPSFDADEMTLCFDLKHKKHTSSTQRDQLTDTHI